MTKSKKHTSRFYVEQESLYETSDLMPPHFKKSRCKKHTKAQEAELESHQKIVAVCAPVETINELITEDDAPAPVLWDTRIDEK